jgi:hypothetical protein
MPRQIVVEFRPDADKASFTHRVRNFGEDLYGVLRHDGRASVDLAEVDRATTLLRITVHSATRLGWAQDEIKKLLKRHHLAASVSLQDT